MSSGRRERPSLTERIDVRVALAAVRLAISELVRLRVPRRPTTRGPNAGGAAARVEHRVALNPLYLDREARHSRESAPQGPASRSYSRLAGARRSNLTVGDSTIGQQTWRLARLAHRGRNWDDLQKSYSRRFLNACPGGRVFSARYNDRM